MKHIMRWLGRIENNYKDLQPNPTQFITSTRAVASVSPFPSDFEGIRFYCMENMKSGKSIGHVVMVENIKLSPPLLLDYEKHTDGKRIGPAGCSFGDKSAKTLLIDIAGQNPDQREAISQIYEKHFRVGLPPVTPDEKVNPTPLYLPTQNDFENARRKCLRDGKTEVSIDAFLDAIRDVVTQSRKNLSPDWRGVTKTSISSWSRNKRGKNVIR